MSGPVGVRRVHVDARGASFRGDGGHSIAGTGKIDVRVSRDGNSRNESGRIPVARECYLDRRQEALNNSVGSRRADFDRYARAAAAVGGAAREERRTEGYAIEFRSDRRKTVGFWHVGSRARRRVGFCAGKPISKRRSSTSRRFAIGFQRRQHETSGRGIVLRYAEAANETVVKQYPACAIFSPFIPREESPSKRK